MATNAYADLQDVQDQLDIADGRDDLLLDLCLGAASRAVDAWCGRRFYKDTSATARYFGATVNNLLDVDDFYTSTALVIQTDKSDSGTWDTTWDVTDYELHPVNNIAGGREGWPYTQIRAIQSYEYFPVGGEHNHRVKITARWGWSSVPEEVKLATVLKAVRLYRRKFSPDGAAGGFEMPVIRINAREDPDVAALLGPFRKLGALVA